MRERVSCDDDVDGELDGEELAPPPAAKPTGGAAGRH
jgi:hypothetical protein